MEAVEVVVSYTGIGIAPEALELIFTKFYQAGSSQHHSTSKTNLRRWAGAGTGDCPWDYRGPFRKIMGHQSWT
jgi:signal transduction histidine kinase